MATRTNENALQKPVVAEDRSIDMKAVKLIVGDLLEPRPLVYWADFTASITLAWACLWFASSSEVSFGLRVLALVANSFLFYRSLFFIHEIAHSNRPWVRPFSTVWNMLCGAILFQPTSTYGISHLDHHKSNTFGTASDPRYVPLGLGSRAAWLVPLFLNIWIAPVLLAVRFIVLGPISILIGGRFRNWVIQHMSTIAMNLKYIRPLPNAEQRMIGVLQEVYATAFWCAVVVLWSKSIVPAALFLNTYLSLVLIMAYNYIRSLCAHRYTNPGQTVDFSDQLLDSISVVSPWSIAALLAPVGLRYHSLHHLLPSLPYHSMTAAHRRLMRQLPQNHPYRRTIANGMLEVLSDLWKRTGENQAQRIVPE
ncbi:MAG: fatty acid desaturase [Bdellovibrionota bacterium]